MDLPVLLILFVSFASLYTGIFWLLLITSEKRDKGYSKIDRYPSVAIIIPAKNAEDSIEYVISSAKIQRATYPGDIKILVVDDGSTDRTFEIAIKHGVGVIRTSGIGKAAAVNLAAKKVDTDLIVIWDADTVVESGGVKKLVEILEARNYFAVSSATYPWAREKQRASFLFKMQEMEYAVGNLTKDAVGKYGLHTILSGAVTVIRRREFLELGGFDENFLTEDFELGVRAVVSGKSIGYDITTKAFTMVPLAFSKWLTQRLRWFRGRLEVLARHFSAIFTSKSELKWILLGDVLALMVILTVFFLILRSVLLATKKKFVELMGKMLSGQIFVFSSPDLGAILLRLKFTNLLPLFIFAVTLLFMFFFLFVADRKKRSPKELLGYAILYPKALILAWLLSIRNFVLGVEKRW